MAPAAPPWPRRAWIGWLLLGLSGSLLFLALAVWTPDGGREASWCAFRRATGVACPGCGLTRSVSALAHGEIGRSLRIHPLGLAFVAQAAAGWGLAGARGLLGARRRWLTPVRAGGSVGARSVAAQRVIWLTAPDRVSRWLLGNAAVLVAVWLVRFAAGTLPS